MSTRQQIRWELFDRHFERFHGAHVPKDMPSRKERRKLARAYAARDWNKAKVSHG